MSDIKAAFAKLRADNFGGAMVRFESGTPKKLTVNTSSTQLLPGNPNRTGWAVVNTSSNPGHLDYSNLVATDRGYPVAQNGGVVTSKFTDIDGGETVKEAIFGLNETAGGTWYIVAWELA